MEKTKMYTGIIDISKDMENKKIGIYELELPYGISENPTSVQEEQAQQFMFQFREVRDMIFSYQEGEHYIGDCFGKIIKKRAKRYLENSWPSILRTSNIKDYDIIMNRLIKMSEEMNICLIQDGSSKERLIKISQILNISDKIDYWDL